MFFAVVWGASAVVFLFSDQFGIPHYTHPIALSCFFLVFSINTLNFCFRHARFWLLKALVSGRKHCTFISRSDAPLLADFVRLWFCSTRNNAEPNYHRNVSRVTMVSVCASLVSRWFLYFIFQWRVLTAPFHHVGFADFWLADQLNSLVVAILDMEYLSCFYALDYYSVQGELGYYRYIFVSVRHVFGNRRHQQCSLCFLFSDNVTSMTKII